MRSSLNVHTYLLDRGIPHEICSLQPRLSSIEDACPRLGLSPAEIVRVTAFETPDGPVVVLTTLDDEPSTASVEQLTAAPATKLHPERTSRITGYVARWVPPVAHERTCLVLVDEALLRPEIVYSSCGEPGALLKLRSEDLLEATGGRLASLVPAASYS